MKVLTDSQLNKSGIKNEKYDKFYTDFISSGDSIKDLKWLNRTAEIFIRKGVWIVTFILRLLLYYKWIQHPNLHLKWEKDNMQKEYRDAINYFVEAYENEELNNINKSKYAFYSEQLLL